MIFSNNLQRRVGKAVCVATLSALLATGCSGGGGKPAEGTESASTPSADGASQGQVAKDGRTLQPGKIAQSCELMSPAAIHAALGPWAANLQDGQGESSVDREGTLVDSCVYPLEAQAGTDHSLIIERKEYTSSQLLQVSKPFGMLMTEETVSGLQGDARYGSNVLSGSTEFVLVSVSGSRVSRILVSEPTSSTKPDAADAKRMLLELASRAGF